MLASRLHLTLSRYVRNHYFLELSPAARVGRGIRLANVGSIRIDAGVSIGDECILDSNASLERTDGPNSGAPMLGAGVMVGFGAVISGPVTIGERAQIDPYSVVDFDVPALSRVASASPRVVRLARPPQ